MKKRHSALMLGAAAVAVGTLTVEATFPTVAGAQSSASVTIDGNAVNLNPPPLERAGRIFVPLRGVFEKLGATVVYQGGVINATGNNRNISLRIGSTQASVNGQGQQLDVAPFIIGASTYVPLRFVASALGDQVNWDNANRVVAISTNGGGGAPPQASNQTITPQPRSGSPIGLSNLHPASGETVAAKRPTVEANFANIKADPNTIKVYLDQLDITNETSRSPNGIVFSPPSDLEATEHTVRVTGKDTNGAAFDKGWKFTSGTSVVTNVIDNFAPAENAQVKQSFIVSGHTLPNSHVTIEAGAIASVGGVFALGTGSYRGDTTADASGNFSQQVQINAVQGGSINLVVTSTEPKSKAAAQIKRRLSVS